MYFLGRFIHPTLEGANKSLFMCVLIGSTNVSAYGLELHSSLTSEIHFLRKQNEALSMMLEKGTKGKESEATSSLSPKALVSKDCQS